jgi:TRAP-type mannitol/chloroaromatic compound transport system permease small subunit
MKIQNIIKIISAIVGVLAAFFLLRIIGTGDEDIKMAATMGDFSTVSPLVELARVVLLITVVITLIFTLLGLFSDPAKLKKALISIGLFLAVVAISYVLSDGVETPLKDGEVLSASGAKWVGTGIRTFYILAVIAISLMLFSGISKIIKK